jgi:hypothetical protein
VNKITEGTVIPLSVAGVVAVLAFYLATDHTEIQTHGKMLETVTSKQEQYTQDMSEIKESLAEIKGELKRGQ